MEFKDKYINILSYLINKIINYILLLILSLKN
jgi:hypothetical protein